MWESIVTFFSQVPPAADPMIVPWVAGFIAGNIITITVIWTILKQVAKITPWAGDDKVIQIFTGVLGAVKTAVTPLLPKKNSTTPVVVEECEHKPDSPNGEICANCGEPIK
jgi:hypothetical protein